MIRLDTTSDGKTVGSLNNATRNVTIDRFQSRQRFSNVRNNWMGAIGTLVTISE